MAHHDVIANDMGGFIRLYNTMEAFLNGGAAYTADGMEQIRTELDATFDSDATHLRMAKAYNDVIDDARNQIQRLKMRVIKHLIEPYLLLYVRPDIASTAINVPGILGDLYDQMVADSEKVLKCSVAMGAITAGAYNTGNGLIFLSIKDVWGNDNESVQNENHLFVCIKDQYTGGATASKEVFSWQSTINGLGPTITVCTTEGGDNTGDYKGGYNRIDNGDFEAWTVTNTPDDWDVDAGTVTTNIAQDQTDEFDGASCLEILGDGATATIQISQSYADFINYSSSKLEPKGVYVLSAAVKAIGCEAMDAGTLTIQLAGTGISNSATTDIILTLDNTAPTTWTMYGRRIQLPKAINADTELVIKVTGTFTNGNKVRVDNVVFAKMYEFPKAGVFCAIMAGGTDWVAGNIQPDYGKAASTNDFAGTIQTFMTKKHDPKDPKGDMYLGPGIHLPSDTAATANWADTKAQ